MAATGRHNARPRAPRRKTTPVVVRALRAARARLDLGTRGRIVLGALVAASLVAVGVTVDRHSADASPPQTFSYYLDAPFVQNSFVLNEFPLSTQWASFDDGTTGGQCPLTNQSGVAFGTPTPGKQGCMIHGGESFDPTNINPEWAFGGASAGSSSDPYVGGTLSKYAQGGSRNGPQEWTLDGNYTYFGIWWTAGSIGNRIQLYSDSTMVAQVSADDIAQSISSNTSLAPGDPALGTYSTSNYLGNPGFYDDQPGAGYVSPCPNGNTVSARDHSPSHTTTIDCYEAYAYLHLVAQPGVTFNRVVISAPGNGFEFDNVVVSSEDPANILSSPTMGRLIAQPAAYQPHTVHYDANGGDMSYEPIPDQSSSSPEALYGYCDFNPYTYTYPNGCLYPPGDAYTFRSWNTAANGTGTDFVQGGWPDYKMTPTFSFDHDITAYAQWALASNYMVLYNDFDPGASWGGGQYTGPALKMGLDPTSGKTVAVDGGVMTLPPEPTDAKPTPTAYFWGWYYWYPSAPAGESTDPVFLGNPGDTLTFSSYQGVLNTFGTVYGMYSDSPPPANNGGGGGGGGSSTPHTTYPVDIKAATVTLPSIPSPTTDGVSLCVDQVDENENPTGSLTFGYSEWGGGLYGNETGTVTVSTGSTTAILNDGVVHVRYRWNSAGNDCTTGLAHIFDLTPMTRKDNTRLVVPLQ